MWSFLAVWVLPASFILDCRLREGDGGAWAGFEGVRDELVAIVCSLCFGCCFKV